MIDLDELMRLHDAATPGPWRVEEISHILNDQVWFSEIIKAGDGLDEKIVNQGAGKNDAAYIVSACNAVPELVARILELEAQRDWLAQAAANAGWHGVRVGKEYMIEHARMAGRVQDEHPKCPTPETPCHARNGELCMSDNHIACAQAVKEDSFIMHRFTEVK